MPALHPVDADAVALGAALRVRRRELGLSQTALAARLAERSGDSAVSRQTISNMERGLSGGRRRSPGNPEWRTLLSLCDALEANLVVDMTHVDGVHVAFVDRAHGRRVDRR